MRCGVGEARGGGEEEEKNEGWVVCKGRARCAASAYPGHPPASEGLSLLC